MTKILEFSDVSYSYHQNDNPILDKINYTFATGVFYTVVGSSGSGKTTFLSLAGGLDSQKDGDIFYKGLSLKKIGLNKYRNQYVSIVFQSYNLLTYMTALQNVTTAMEITHVDQKDKRQFALDMLAKVGIDEKMARQKVLTLSGGQQQRVSIARALCCETDLIVADEPTGNLDERTSKEVVSLFQDLAHKEGKCVIMVTHDPEIAKVSDVKITMKNGKFDVKEQVVASI
ncbi:ABC transporter ATP-binding protein [Listeria weihenstephanensis FSL R9-0317]|uniref:ABC transporter n=1 Tax=Listeria weihenstephanensis TaxID=1006155 RepID=A0A1S7FV10_9LIST|nr:ABC transporter ATP-binding protein [Listeria weihenstephanensis]AQY51232.1 ABC transporter [Listeria weihenstephanensis]EUJ36835.1 ABC transporter ATP-binding protein [Listeria weihenstephanensis FSL R9-0317]MBC1501092.1 ABC transporter ATP-binding protein [Listeria weihenstephanensis]